MSRGISPILQANELLELMQTEGLVIVDVSNSKDARANYHARHLDGALFVDVNTQLSDIKRDLSKGGRHPLPTLDQFSEILTGLGITPDSQVVIYDDKNDANAAARFWWMLKSIGHQKVQVLNGGLQEAEKKGFPINSGSASAKSTDPYKAQEWKLPLSDIQEVERVSKDERYMVIDVRESDRYDGITEPIDLIAGHIPGAINVPYVSNLDDYGYFLSREKLRAAYQAIFGKVSVETSSFIADQE